jgi:hypothetical protein
MTDATFTLDQDTLQALITKVVEDKLIDVAENLTKDPVWLAALEKSLNQRIVHQTMLKLNSTDVNAVIKEQVDANICTWRENNFKSIGIEDLATKTQFTVMDEATVVENTLATKSIKVVDTAIINNLSVSGSINVDNHSWNNLSTYIAEKTLASLTDSWKDQLIADVAAAISTDGINFDKITVDGELLINGNKLSSTITDSQLTSVGTLVSLDVAGSTNLDNVLVTKNNRVGINTTAPEMALSIWDEEISVNIGKFKADQAYIGTSRPQAMAIGVNRNPQIELDIDGLTTIKKLRIGKNIINHNAELPGWQGTRGDIVFNSNFKDDYVFAWICTGGYNWQPLKSA